MKTDYHIKFLSLTCSERENDSKRSAGLNYIGTELAMRSPIVFNQSFDYIICSASQACKETLKILKLPFEEEIRLVNPIEFYLPDMKSDSYKSNPLDYRNTEFYHESFKECWLRICGFLFELAYKQSVEKNKNYLICLEPEVVTLLRVAQYKTKKKHIGFLKTNLYVTTEHNFNLSDIDYLLNI